MLEIPFYLNKGHRCAETCVRSVLKYYFPRGEHSLKQIQELIRKKPSKLVYPFQLANALLDLGLKVEYYSAYRLEEYLMKDLEMKKREFYKFYGKNAEKIMKHTDFSVLEQCIDAIIKSKSYKKSYLDFNQLEKAFSENNLIICLLNFDILVGRENNHNGHYVTITDVDKENVWYHECGPKNTEANKKVEKKKFIDSWKKMCFFDEGTLFIKGVIASLGE